MIHSFEENRPGATTLRADLDIHKHSEGDKDLGADSA
jgi:hypothetical protein